MGFIHRTKAQPTEVDGIKFASKAEARRYGELKLLLREKEIRDLKLQPRFDLWICAVRLVDSGDGEPMPMVLGEENGRSSFRNCGFYKADFRYVEVKTGKTVIEDVKGIATATYRLKKRLVEALYGIKIREV